MVKLEFLEQIKKQVDRIGMMRKNIAARICHRLEGPTYSTKEQQRRRKIMFYVGGSVALALTGGITYTILNKNITITLEKGDNPRRRIRNIYDKYGLDEQMRSIYTSESYTSYENTEKRFRIFFLACASDLFYLQEKDVYQVGDSFTFNPSKIVEKIMDNPLLWHEESILNTTENGGYKKENEQLHTQREERFNNLFDKEKKDSPSPSTTLPEEKSPGKKTKKETPDQEPPIVIKEKEEPAPNLKGNKLQRHFIESSKNIAIEEMREYMIPASITLAQGIIESNSGTSPLTKITRNYFGMKCYNEKCTKKGTPKDNGHCYRRKDDNRWDRFFHYASKKKSFRAHSQLLSTGRYRILREADMTKKRADAHFNTVYEAARHKGESYYEPRKALRKKALDNRDIPHKRWAYGLSAMGYATSPTYATKLLTIIDQYDLTQYDE